MDATQLVDGRPAHLLDTLGLSGMREFYDLIRVYPTSTTGDIALILSHIAYHCGHEMAKRVTVRPSRGHSYRVTGFYGECRIVRIVDYYDHRDGVTGLV